MSDNPNLGKPTFGGRWANPGVVPRPPVFDNPFGQVPGGGIEIGTSAESVWKQATDAWEGWGEEVWDWITGDDENGSVNGEPSPLPSTTGQAGANIAGCQITVPVQAEMRAKCPPGYVVVHPPGQGKQCMLKGVAIKCGLYKSPKKPPIKASEWDCLKKANRVVNKLDRVVAMSNNVVGKNKMRRVSSKR